MKGIIAEIKRVKCEGILMIVSNPVDILTEVALRESGFPKERVIGSGTVLDTARFKYLISQKLDVDSKNVHAFIAGEHGDSELAVWSCANVYGIPLDEFARIRGIGNLDRTKDEIYHAVRDSAYEIIERKGATYYEHRDGGGKDRGGHRPGQSYGSANLRITERGVRTGWAVPEHTDCDRE